MAGEDWILEPLGLSRDELPAGPQVMQLQCGPLRARRRVHLTAQAYIVISDKGQRLFLRGSSGRDTHEIGSCVDPMTITVRLKHFRPFLYFGHD